MEYIGRNQAEFKRYIDDENIQKYKLNDCFNNNNLKELDNWIGERLNDYTNNI